MSERVYLLLPVHNRRALSVKFAEALRRQTHRDFQLVLIDDGSTDGTAEAVRECLPDAVVIRGTGAWWWTGSLERGCDWLTQQSLPEDTIVAFINDDVEIAPEFLAHAVAELRSQPATLLLARQIDAATGREIDGGGGVHADVRRLRFRAAASPDEINCLPTRGLFLRWGDVVRAGRFRPARLPHYLSDYEFTLRAQRRGLHLRVATTFAVSVQLQTTGTGRAELFALPRAQRIPRLFSPRCKENPFAWSAFAALASPAALRPWLWFKIWAHALLLIVRCALTPVPKNVSR